MAERDLGSWIEEGIAAGYPTWILEAADPALGPVGDFVGAAGVFPPENEWGPEPEVGCLLASRHHGRGLATEALVRRHRRRDGAARDPGPGRDHRRGERRVDPPRGQVRLRAGAVVHGQRRRPVPALRARGGRRRAAIMPPMPDLDHARRLRHPRRPRRRRARRAGGRRQPADLPDLDVCPGRRRAAAGRLRVRPDAEPDPRAAGAGRRRAGRRGVRDRVRVRVGGDGHAGRAGRPGRGDRRRRRRLRGDVPLLRARGAAARRGRPLRGPGGGPGARRSRARCRRGRGWSGSRRRRTRCSR